MGHGSGVSGWIASFTAHVLERLVLQKFCLPFELSHTKYCPSLCFGIQTNQIALFIPWVWLWLSCIAVMLKLQNQVQKCAKLMVMELQLYTS